MEEYIRHAVWILLRWLVLQLIFLPTIETKKIPPRMPRDICPSSFWKLARSCLAVSLGLLLCVRRARMCSFCQVDPHSAGRPLGRANLWIPRRLSRGLEKNDFKGRVPRLKNKMLPAECIFTVIFPYHDRLELSSLCVCVFLLFRRESAAHFNAIPRQNMENRRVAFASCHNTLVG